MPDTMLFGLFITNLTKLKHFVQPLQGVAPLLFCGRTGHETLRSHFYLHQQQQAASGTGVSRSSIIQSSSVKLESCRPVVSRLTPLPGGKQFIPLYATPKIRIYIYIIFDQILPLLAVLNCRKNTCNYKWSLFCMTEVVHHIINLCYAKNENNDYNNKT